MKWQKRGLIFAPKKDQEWNQKYSILPTPVVMEEEGIIRVFYGTTDVENFGRITSVDLDIDDPSKVVASSDEVLVDLGEIGTFDDCGVVPSCMIKVGEKYYMYTVGFQRTVRAPYMLFAGLVSSEDLVNFERVSRAPILPREEGRHISQGAPCVIYDEGAYKMWHWYATEWLDVDGKLFMNYHVGYAESDDAVEWKMSHEPCLAPEADKGEFAVARPWVMKREDGYHMYYSTRYVECMYRITYAYSADGKKWEKRDAVPFTVSDEGWDSEMVCYPSIIEVKGKTYMFYNGNNNGETGFGFAELID